MNYIYFNLQRFAEVQTTLLPGLSVENKTHYDNTLIVTAGPELVHDQFGQKRPIPRNGGKSIEFRRFIPLPKALTPLTEGYTPEGNRLEVTAIEAKIAQYGDFVVLTDMLELTAIDKMVVETTKLIGKQAGQTLDTITRNALHKGTNVSYAPRFDADGNEIEVLSRKDLDKTAVATIDFVEDQVAKLKASNAPKIDGSYVCIIHPYITRQLRRDPDWIRTHDYKSDVKLFTGEVGEWAGVRFVESTEAKIYCGEDLSYQSRNLTATEAVNSSKTVKFKAADQVDGGGLVGRYVLINGVKALVEANTNSTLTLDVAVTCDAGTTIYPGEGGAEGLAVFSMLFLGEGAYGVTEITGGGLEVILKQLGEGEDRLNQRSSVGWKATKTAKILVEDYLIRAECTCKHSSKVFAPN